MKCQPYFPLEIILNELQVIFSRKCKESINNLPSVVGKSKKIWQVVICLSFCLLQIPEILELPIQRVWMLRI